MENSQAVVLLKNAYERLRAADAEKARDLLEQAMDYDYENEEIKHALKCVNWWLSQTGRLDEYNNYEKGGHLISLLKQYKLFLDQLDDIYDQCQYSLRCFVYSKALFYFEKLLLNTENQKDPGLLLLVGRCYKGIGNYDKALSFLEQAFRLKHSDAQILCEIADVNALLSETKTAKALFREAFFLDPFAIDLEFLESALIVKLRDEVALKGYENEELSAWLPIYGYLWGVLSVKRELKQMEAGRLKQSIFALEAEYEANPNDKKRRALLKPRLLNHYFWLIDHYEIAREDTQLIDETLLKIKVLDPEIHKIYSGS